jgi:general secretion pathway protein M
MDKGVISEQIRRAIEPAMGWYQGREPREQLVLRILAMMLAITLFWFLVLNPLKSARDQARQGWISAEQTRQWIEANSEAVRQARARTSTGRPSGDWIASLNARAAEYQVTLKGYTPEGDQSVRVLLEDQSFANVMAWLLALSQDVGVSPSSIEISEGGREGAINVRATLERGV